MYTPSIQNQAKEMYLGGNKTQTQIAGQLGIHHKTLSNWIKQNNWRDVKTISNWASFVIQQNLFEQLLAFQASILEREENKGCPTLNDVTLQSKLIAGIFRFPQISEEDIMGFYKEELSIDKNKLEEKDKNPQHNIDNQQLDKIEKDRKEIKNEEKVTPVSPIEKHVTEGTDKPEVKRRNIVLRSGARWIERGTVYDPIHKRNRQIRKPEWDELLSKGLTKKDFDGFVFQ